MFIDKLADIVNKYINTYYCKIKMKLIDVKSNICFDFSEQNNDKDPKFKIGE